MFKRKLLYLSLILSFCFPSFADRKTDLLNVINQELNELIRLSKVSRNRDPEAQLRIAELYLEKARIIRENENEIFFSKSIEERKKISRKELYKESTEEFEKAQRVGIDLVKRFPKFKNIGDAYYILAFNEKENQNLQKSKDLFVLATKKTKRGSNTDTKSRLALGDIYYSEGDFKRAKAYYDTSINLIKEDRWYTRYLYNLSWSNFRVGNKKLALEQMQKVHSLSSSPKFIDKKENAQRDIGYFYADTGNVTQAQNFYAKTGGNSAKNFYEMGMQLKDKQKYSEALGLFKAAFQTNDKVYGQKSYLEILSMLDKYNNNSEFVKYALQSKKLDLSDKDELKEVLFYITKRAAIIQKELQQSHNQKRPKVMHEKSEQTVTLYLLAKDLDPNLAEQSYFFAAESRYQAGNYNEALEYYGYILEKGDRNSKFYNKSLEGMLLSINMKGVSKDLRLKYFEKIYKEYITIVADPSKKNKAVEKLFSFAIDEKNDVKLAEDIFFGMQKVMNNTVLKNEAMIANIVDIHKKQKDKKGLLEFVSRLKGQNVAISNKFLQSLSQIVLVTQFEDVQNANSRGDKAYALKAYIAIYKSDSSTVEAKRNAAYNIAILFYELGNVRLMSQWLQRSIAEMTPGEVNKFTDSINLVIKDLYLRQRFDEGSRISENLLDKICSLSNKTKSEIISNYLLMNMATGNVAAAEAFVNKQRICKTDSKQDFENTEEFFSYYLSTRDLGRASEYLSKIDGKTKNTETLVRHYGSIFKLYRELNVEIPKASLSRFTYLSNRVSNYTNIGIDAIDMIALNKLSTLEAIESQLNSMTLSFPEAKFNAMLMKKLNLLQTLTTKSAEVLKVGSAEGAVKTYNLLIRNYVKLATEISSFKPEGKSEEYMAGFSKNMSSITTPLFQKSRSFESELVEQVEKNSLLSESFGSNIRKNVDFIHSNLDVIMDKRGQL